MRKIVVTGGSGRAGRAVVRDLLAHGYQVVNVDQMQPRDAQGTFLQADLSDLGQTYQALRGADGLVHLAAIPAPGLATEGETFRVNMLTNYNVFSAALAQGVQRIVWASSATVYGIPYEQSKPDSLPVDEAHPLYPNSSYALSKILTEEMAVQMNRWSGVPFVGLRFTIIIDAGNKGLGGWQTNADFYAPHLFGYVEAQDAAQACRLGLTAAISGAKVYTIAGAETLMPERTQTLVEHYFPGVPLRADIGEYESLLDSAKAMQELGYQPTYSWRAFQG